MRTVALREPHGRHSVSQPKVTKGSVMSPSDCQALPTLAWPSENKREPKISPPCWDILSLWALCCPQDSKGRASWKGTTHRIVASGLMPIF